jgi:hypothetical protein
MRNAHIRAIATSIGCGIVGCEFGILQSPGEEILSIHFVSVRIPPAGHE